MFCAAGCSNKATRSDSGLGRKLWAWRLQCGLDIANREVLTKRYSILLHGLSRWHCPRNGRNLCDDDRKENANGGRKWEPEIRLRSLPMPICFLAAMRLYHPAKQPTSSIGRTADTMCATRSALPGMIEAGLHTAVDKMWAALDNLGLMVSVHETRDTSDGIQSQIGLVSRKYFGRLDDVPERTAAHIEQLGGSRAVIASQTRRPPTLRPFNAATGSVTVRALPSINWELRLLGGEDRRWT